jgi:hypothetical protein
MNSTPNDPSLKISKLFSAMSHSDENIAIRAMDDARKLLGENGLQFGSFVTQIEDRKLLMPAKLAGAIRLMDSITDLESISALRAARSLLYSYGYNFSDVIVALEAQSGSSQEAIELRESLVAYQIVNRDLATQNAAMMSENIELRGENKRLGEFEAANHELLERIQALESNGPGNRPSPATSGILRINLSDDRGHSRRIPREDTEYKAAGRLICDQGRRYKARSLAIEKLLPNNFAEVRNEDGVLALLNHNGERVIGFGRFHVVISNDVKSLRIGPTAVAAAEFEPGKIYLSGLRPPGVFRKEWQKWDPQEHTYQAMDATRFNYLFAPANI